MTSTITRERITSPPGLRVTAPSIINEDSTLRHLRGRGRGEASTWGINSDKFIDAYAAGSAPTVPIGTTDMIPLPPQRPRFCHHRPGRFLGASRAATKFYGFGTWNISSFDTDKSVINNQIMATPHQRRTMPSTPRVKNAMYESESYGNTSKSSWSGSEIQDAMKSRQNLWGAPHRLRRLRHQRDGGGKVYRRICMEDGCRRGSVRVPHHQRRHAGQPHLCRFADAQLYVAVRRLYHGRRLLLRHRNSRA